ncbi:NAD-dependent epimerase/dehydratase family protein [Herbidospora galbida]|uniref:NAD-dependent epimerase/dehydratase family protein n=1 Tax=Herbidospora galbida TaxID=2575442 RepID=A0A4U3MNC8_9ACTN|nr:NAD-dependent epimerase/dehydratase family protein [Herbidospora galbida]TKK90530.1 NAD-dependent epimerase/dehydratase family protein [Herbidospora galbida]
METVLITGGTGFLATRVIAAAQEAGYDVRTTVRHTPVDGVPSVVADLTSDEGWDEAVAGCDYVLHVASPLPAAQPVHEDEVIIPARDGTLRVLRAARDAGVRRTVVTSSFAAIGYGHPETDRPFTEDDWTRPDADIAAYPKSKVIAEQAAWAFDRGAMELAVVNPTGIFGPVVGPRYASSIRILAGLLDGSMRAIPNMWFGMVDVRDAADLHLRAMTSLKAAGERFIGASGDAVSMAYIAQVLRERLGATTPTDLLPDEVVRELAETDDRMAELARNVGRIRHLSNAKARSVLGWNPRPTEDVIADTGRSLIEGGYL